MKFDPTVWQEMHVGGFVMDAPGGYIRLNASDDVALYVSCNETEDDDVLVGTARSFDVQLTGVTGVRFYVTGGPETRAFLYVPGGVARDARDGSWTNPDRPDMMESGHMAAVLQELRRFKLEAREQLQSIRRQRAGAVPAPVAPVVAETEAPAPAAS